METHFIQVIEPWQIPNKQAGMAGMVNIGVLTLLLVKLILVSSSTMPNIVFILADDLGYNDVSWHNPDIKTPNLEALARSGVILENNYVQPICTPTRSALLTGRSTLGFDLT